MDLTPRQALDKSIDDYNHDTNQAFLKALTGGVGDWVRHDPKTNLGDLLGSSSNDNQPQGTPVQMDLFPETLTEGE